MNNQEELNEKYIYPSIAIFLAYSFPSVKFMRVLPENFSKSTCYVADKKNKTLVNLPFRAQTPLPNIKNEVYGLVKYVFNNEIANKNKSNPISDIKTEKIFYRRIVDLLNEINSHKKTYIGLLQAMTLFQDSLSTLTDLKSSSNSEIISFDLAWELTNFVLENREDTITVSDLQNVFDEYFYEENYEEDEEYIVDDYLDFYDPDDDKPINPFNKPTDPDSEPGDESYYGKD